MRRIKINSYLDIIVTTDRSLEEIEESIKKAEEESKKLTEWPEIE